MNIAEEVNKLITEYFRKHAEILMNGKDAMLRDNYAKLDAIDLVCDIANVYNSAVYQSVYQSLNQLMEEALNTNTISAYTSFTSQDMDKLAKAVYSDSYHMKGEDK